MTCLKSGPFGEITLPKNLRARHGIERETPIRVIETRNGILLIPLTSAPMSPALSQELKEWQSLALSGWDKFEYDCDSQ